MAFAKHSTTIQLVTTNPGTPKFPVISLEVEAEGGSIAVLKTPEQVEEFAASLLAMAARARRMAA